MKKMPPLFTDRVFKSRLAHLLLREQGLMGTVGRAVSQVLPIAVGSLPEQNHKSLCVCLTNNHLCCGRLGSHLCCRYLLAGNTLASFPEGAKWF